LVLGSSNCGQSWTKVYQKQGAELATAPAAGNSFLPTAEQWANDSAVFNTSNGQAMFAVVGRSGFGNMFYLDDPNIAFSGVVQPPQPCTTLVDITTPTSPISIWPTVGSSSPANEQVGKAIDNLTNTKYLNFFGAGSGLTVDAGSTRVIKAISLTSANDVPSRDPSSYQLSGSNDGVNFVTISSGAVALFTARFQRQVINFSNEVGYRYYRLIFPTVIGASCGNCSVLQVAEVELLACQVAQARIKPVRLGIYDVYGRPALGNKQGIYWRDGKRVAIW
jgi:hypothetical protein